MVLKTTKIIGNQNTVLKNIEYQIFDDCIIEEKKGRAEFINLPVLYIY